MAQMPYVQSFARCHIKFLQGTRKTNFL